MMQPMQNLYIKSQEKSINDNHWVCDMALNIYSSFLVPATAQNPHGLISWENPSEVKVFHLIVPY